MSGRRTETPHNSPEQVRDYLRAGLLVVEELDVPDDLRPVAFRKAVELLAAKHITVESASPLAGLAIPLPRGH